MTTWLTLAFAAAFFKAFATISEKEILLKKDIFDYVSAGSFLVAIISTPLLYFVKDMSLTLETIFFIFASSILSVTCALSLSYIVKKLDISESSALISVTPIMVAIFGAFLIKEFLSWIQVLGIITSSIGLFVLEFKTKGGVDSKNLRNEYTGPVSGRIKIYTILLLGLVTFGLSSIADRFIIHYVGVDPLLFLVIIQLFITLNMFIFDVVKNAFSEKGTKQNKFIDTGLLMQKAFWANIIFIIAHRIAHVFAINLIAASILNAVKQVNVIVLTVFGGKIFKEENLIKKTFACVIILVGVVMVIL
jgi:drug/metabolite transporter (DMT)-like permease